MKLKINDEYINIKIATKFNERLKGLMGQQNIDYGMLFPKCNAIHTYFMKEPIDVIALNENNEIVFIIKSLFPNKIFQVKKDINCSAILELPNNSSNSFQLGDKIVFIN